MRDWGSEITTRLADGTYVLRHLFWIACAEGNYGLWTGSGDIAIAGDTYWGDGGIVEWPDIPGQVDFNIVTVELKLAALDERVKTIFYGKTWHQKRAILYEGVLNPLTKNWPAAPVAMFDGFADRIEDVLSAENEATISLSIDSRARLATKTNPETLSDAHQRRRNTEDNAFEMLPIVAERKISLGRRQRVKGRRTTRGKPI